MVISVEPPKTSHSHAHHDLGSRNLLKGPDHCHAPGTHPSVLSPLRLSAAILGRLGPPWFPHLESPQFFWVFVQLPNLMPQQISGSHGLLWVFSIFRPFGPQGARASLFRNQHFSKINTSLNPFVPLHPSTMACLTIVLSAAALSQLDAAFPKLIWTLHRLIHHFP